MEFARSTIFFTGGASGMGCATVEAAVAAGVRATICDLESSDGDALAMQPGPRAIAPADIMDSERVWVAIDQGLGHFGRIDNCINAAGAAMDGGFLGDASLPYPIENFRRVIELNLVATFDVCRQIASAIARQWPDANGCRGLIPIAALDGTAGQIAYVAAKARVMGITLSLARAPSNGGIRAMCLCSGRFRHSHDGRRERGATTAIGAMADISSSIGGGARICRTGPVDRGCSVSER